MALDEDKMRELDKYNLLRLFEAVSVGNLLRVTRWTVAKVRDGFDRVAQYTDIQPRPKKR